MGDDQQEGYARLTAEQAVTASELTSVLAWAMEALSLAYRDQLARQHDKTAGVTRRSRVRISWPGLPAARTPSCSHRDLPVTPTTMMCLRSRTATATRTHMCSTHGTCESYLFPLQEITARRLP